MRITILVLTCLISEAAVAAELSGQQLRLALIGQPIHWWEKDGWHAGEVVFLPDGRAEMFVDTPGSLSDVGRWHINGNQICTSWTRLRGDSLKCYTVDRIGPNRFHTSGGNIFEVVLVGT